MSMEKLSVAKKKFKKMYLDVKKNKDASISILKLVKSYGRNFLDTYPSAPAAKEIKEQVKELEERILKKEGDLRNA